MSFVEKLQEHFRAPSPSYDHTNITSHHNSVDSFSIVGRDLHTLTRTIKEAMFIRANGPSLNRNIGKFQLSHLFNAVLLNSPDLKLK